jgi:IS4 transposase
MFIPVGVVLFAIAVAGFSVILFAWLWVIAMEKLWKPSDLSDEDVEMIQRALDKSQMENARRREQIVNELSRN